MALVVSISNEDKSRRSSFRAEKRPWMLQDYLRDDVNSCSSNGFKSFPRRECCAVAVKNIIDGRNSSKPPEKRLAKKRTVSSALYRASMAVINAVKFLPFKSPASGETKRILPRSFSKKLFMRSFWSSKKPSRGGERKVVEKKDNECDEIERWISSGIVSSEKYQPSDLSNDTAVTKSSTTARNSDSWSDITFTSSENDAVERREKSLLRNDAVERREKMPLKDVAEVEEEVSERGGATTGDDSVEPAVTTTKKAWSIEEIEKENFSPNDSRNEETEKEQFSPVSIMDFPDNDGGTSSPFTIRATRLKGNRERLTKKLGTSEILSELDFEPINLESLMCSALMKDRSPELSIQSCSTPTFIISSDSEEEEEEDEGNSWINEEEKEAERLLKLVKTEISTNTSHKYELDIVLLDYFRENIMENEENALLKVAEDWLNGHYDRLILGWEVKDKREAYIRDMEERGRWPRETKLEKEEVADELQALVLAHLVEEVLVEFCSF